MDRDIGREYDRGNWGRPEDEAGTGLASQERVVVDAIGRFAMGRGFWPDGAACRGVVVAVGTSKGPGERSTSGGRVTGSGAAKQPTGVREREGRPGRKSVGEILQTHFWNHPRRLCMWKRAAVVGIFRPR